MSIDLKKYGYHPKTLTYEYIRGLVEGEGCFSFHTVPRRGIKRKIPVFAIGMTDRDEELLIKVRNSIGVNSKVYTYPPRQRSDGYRRQGMAILYVRNFGEIKNIIVPLFYKKLKGYKALQFKEWIREIEINPDVLDNYKLIPMLYKNGFYDKNFTNYD